MKNMEKDLAEYIVDLFEEHTDYEVEIHEDYSGRGMFGKTTTGVELDEEPARALLKLMAELLLDREKINTNADKLRDFLDLIICKNYGEDSMGHDYIFY